MLFITAPYGVVPTLLKRSVRNNGTTPLLMLCIQYCSNTFSQEDATDGIILKEPVKWKVSPK